MVSQKSFDVFLMAACVGFRHSLSQRSSSNKQTSKDRPENGSITQEIVEEEIDISVDADDPLKSEVSGVSLFG